MIEAIKRLVILLLLLAVTFLIIWGFLHFALQEEYALETAIATSIFGFGYLLVWQFIIPTASRSRTFSEDSPRHRLFERRAARRARRQQR